LSITHYIHPGIEARDIWMKNPAWSMLSVRGAVNTIGAPAYWPIRLSGSFSIRKYSLWTMRGQARSKPALEIFASATPYRQAGPGGRFVRHRTHVRLESGPIA
jgi:hypothetical protein